MTIDEIAALRQSAHALREEAQQLVLEAELLERKAFRLSQLRKKSLEPPAITVKNGAHSAKNAR